MPSLQTNINKLSKLGEMAPKRNRESVKNVIKLYEDRKITTTVATAEVYKLAYPKNDPSKGADYDVLMARYENTDAVVSKTRKPKQEFTMTVILYTDENFHHLEGNSLTDEQKKKYKKYIHKEFPNLRQFWIGQITVKGGSVKFFDKIKHNLVKKSLDAKGDWKKLFRICLTDESFDAREKRAPGYLDGIYIIDYVQHEDVVPTDPVDSPMRNGEKLAVSFRYCSYVADLSKSTFKEAIKKDHYRKDECWINALYDHYKDSLLRTVMKRNVITREVILEILGRTEENITEGLTIQEVLPFFEKYRLPLRVFDKFYKCIYKFDPTTPNKNEKPFYCMTDGNHIYTLNHDLMRLHQKLDEEDEVQVYASKDYQTPNESRGEVNHRMITHIDDILTILREAEEAADAEEAEGKKKKERELVYLVHQHDDLTEVLWQLKDAKFEPQVKFQAGRLTIMALTLNDTTFIIKTQQLIHCDIDGLIEVDTAEKYNDAYHANATFTGRLLKKELKSYYTQEDMNILDEYRTVASIGWLNDFRPGGLGKREKVPVREADLVEIDVSKAYTAAFMKIKQVPIFNEFDHFRAYNGEELQDLSLYVVEAEVADLFFNKKINLAYGLFLKELPLNSLKITHVKTPSFIKEVDFKDIADELFATELSPDRAEDMLLKKQIANTGYGMLEKGINKNQKSHLFDTYAEARHYQIKYGGTINYIKQYKETQAYKVDPLDKDIVFDDDDGYQIEPTLQTDYEETGKVIYILNISAKASMTNGFRYIKELLVQHHNFLMFNSVQKLKEHGITAYTVKTDALTINKKDLSKAKELLDFGVGAVMEASKILAKGWKTVKEVDIDSLGDILEFAERADRALTLKAGCWRVSKTEGIIFPYELFELKANRMMDIAVPAENNIELSIQDEYDVDKLCAYYEHYKRVMVRAEFGGSGKSYSCEHMEKRGHKVLFVCPTNKLATNYGQNGITLNRFFSIAMSEDAKMKRFDDSPYDTIVFDEIFFADIKVLARIKRYCDEHPEKIVIATGDTNQLETINQISNHLDYDEYSNHCVNLIFPNLMYFRENKRLRSQADKDILRQLKADLFNPDIPVLTTLKKYFTFTEKYETTYNIAYTNNTCDRVSQKVRAMLRKAAGYDVGEVLVCRKWFRFGQNTFNVNYEYTISKVGRNSLVLDGQIDLPLDLVKKNFTYNYCRTCHSFQGSSIGDKITIFDWDFLHVNRKWLYTAITRARDLKNVVFFKNWMLKKSDELRLDTYLEAKVCKYKGQDRKAGRVVDHGKFITKEWLKSCLGKTCRGCGEHLRWEIDAATNTIDSNLTANRVDNSLAHHLDNCEPMCVHCNCSLSNRG